MHPAMRPAKKLASLLAVCKHGLQFSFRSFGHSSVVALVIVVPNKKLSAGFKRFYERVLSTTLDQ
jgi:hypothetical protein